MIRKKVLILTNRFLHNGPRIIREINALKRDYEIIVLGRTKPPQNVVQFEQYRDISLVERMLHKGYRLLNNGRLWNGRFYTIDSIICDLVKKHKPDVIITHEPEFFPSVFQLKKKFDFKIVYNAHEYHPLQFDSDKKWLQTKGRLYTELYSKYLPKLDLLINVCESIAEKCTSEFGVSSIVIPNASTYREDITPKWVTKYPIRMIHHGGAVRSRSIETMIRAASLLGENYQLDLMLVESGKEYFDELKRMADETDNVKIIEPVNFNEIIPFLSDYDIGIYSLQPSSFNQEVALPNKLFEFIQARLCIVVSPSLEMEKVVKTNEVGRVTKDYTANSLAEAIKSLTLENINFHKEKSDHAAQALSAERYESLLQDELRKIVVK